MHDENSSIKVVIDGTKHGVEGSLKKFKRLCESFGVNLKQRNSISMANPAICNNCF